MKTKFDFGFNNERATMFADSYLGLKCPVILSLIVLQLEVTFKVETEFLKCFGYSAIFLAPCTISRLLINFRSPKTDFVVSQDILLLTDSIVFSLLLMKSVTITNLLFIRFQLLIISGFEITFFKGESSDTFF